MKSFSMLIIGLLIGAAATGGVWAWQSQRAGQIFYGVVQMQGDGVVILGIEAAQALNAGSAEALRDFANYVVDQGLLRARTGPTSGAYNATLDTASAAISADQRSLSDAASQLYVTARQQASGE